ncbi:hypothetical protein KJK83_000863 [Campylobacter jejuni]|nr:hypothetical protein [Campylobacter jejuni]
MCVCDDKLIDFVYLNCSCFDFMFVSLNALVCFSVLVMMVALLVKLSMI